MYAKNIMLSKSNQVSAKDSILRENLVYEIGIISGDSNGRKK